MRVTGVDGCRSGWVAVDLDFGPDVTQEDGPPARARQDGPPDGARQDGPPASARVSDVRAADVRMSDVRAAGVPTAGARGAGARGDDARAAGLRVAGVRLGASLDTLLAGAGPGQVVGIDMPLGLLDRGWRTADREARPLLGPRRSSIFAIPPGPVWREPSYSAANQRCRALTGNGFSAQAWGLRRKLLEANEYRLRCRHPLYEVHPELSFRTMAGAPLPHAKHTEAGHAQRLALLAEAGLVIPVGGALRRVAADVLDAAAVAWTARRIAAGLARTVPDPPQTGPDGREVAIRF